MDKNTLKKRIEVAAGRIPADLVIKNCKIIDVYNATIIEGKDIAIVDGIIAGVGYYQGLREIDGEGQYVAPGFIDGHIHIESSYVTPEEIGRLLVPCGTTTIIADPHEIANVCGVEGINYMIEASKKTKLDIKYMLPSCVPATPFENSGAILDSKILENLIDQESILGLGEFMDYPGVIEGQEEVLNKLLVGIGAGKIIDGHSPGLLDNELNAYAITSIKTDHECSTIEEMHQRIACGMYILMREGSACHDLRVLLKGVTKENSRRCLLCSDDRQPKTILESGHINNHLQICVEEGINPIMAIQMATLNAAECYNLTDRGAIAPGLRGDIVLFSDLKEFKVNQVLIRGEVVAKNQEYLFEVKRQDITPVHGVFQIGDFSKEKLKLHLTSDSVHIMEIMPDGVLTAKKVAQVKRDETGDFIYEMEKDLVKIAVVERHHNTGNVAVALIRGYGIKRGAIAISIAHDSHNIIVTGTNDEDMAFAVESLVAQKGGIVLVENQEIINSMPLVVGGIMSDQTGEWVHEKLNGIHQDAHERLGISEAVEPVMTLCFMSLAVIPEIKLTDRGLFDVTKFEFIPLEAE